LIMPNGDYFVLSATLEKTDLFNGTSVNNEGQFKGKGYDNNDLIEMGAGTGGGMLIGGLIGGGKGVLIGGAVGASATVTHWLVKKNSATLPAGTLLTMELSRPLAMTPAPSTPGN
jgi:outer membrane lipoprotein SlyB